MAKMLKKNAKPVVKPAKALKLIVGGDALLKEGRAIIKSIGNMDRRIGLYLLSEIADCEKYRNPTRLNTYFAEIKGKGVRVHAQHAYVQAFGNFYLNEETGKYVMHPKRSAKDAAAAFERASAADWTSFKSEGKAVQFELDKSLSRLLVAAFSNGFTEEDIIEHLNVLKIDAAKKAADALAKAAKAEAAA